MRVMPYAALAAVVASGFTLGVLLASCGARAQHDGHTEGHEEFHDFYKEWNQPHTDLSCCNVKEVYRDSDGKPIGHRGDCYPTKFRPNPLRNEKGHSYWLAQLDDEDRAMWRQEWIEVPDSKIIREKNPDQTGADGHLCVSNGAVLCAVPPTGGS